jgi:RNA polymerase II subunit A small phosphatase-like protein
MPKFNKLLVLDLDETLVYATDKKIDLEPDFQVLDYFIYKRPHLDKFIQTCLEWFDVGVWTSSGEIYAQGVISNIFKDVDRLKIILTSNHCTRKFDHDIGCYYTIKDLKKIVRKTGHPIEQILMIDDSKEKVERNYGNAIIVNEFTGQQDDDELKELLRYLEKIGSVDNVRVIDKLRWRGKV